MKKWPLVVVAAVMPLIYWRGHHGGTQAAKDGERVDVANQLWIDHLPKSQREMIELFVVLRDEGAGIFDQRSSWKYAGEVFTYTRGDKARLDVTFPQTGAREQLTWKAKACDTRDFDYCLEVSGGSHGVKKYYSRKDWEIGSLSDERTKLDAIEAALPTD
jgi:hypothetical protein